MSDTTTPVDRRKELTAAGMGLAWWAGEQPDVVAIESPTGNRTFA